MNIYDQVYDALNNATHENGYPHEYGRHAIDIVLEIDDWSGIEGFDSYNSEHLTEAQNAVDDWRTKNYAV